MTPFQMTSSLDGKEIFARHWPVDNPVAVMTLIHGFGEHCGRYDHMASHLNANNIAVLSMDLRGHGQTEGKRGIIESYEHLIGDIDDLLGHSRASYPANQHYLFGHSMGGGLALYYGLHRDGELEGYLVSAPLILPVPAVPKLQRLVTKLIKPLLSRSAVKHEIPGHYVNSLPEAQKAYEDDPLNHNRIGGELGVGILEAGETILNNAQDWHRPLRLWHAKADKLTSFLASQEFASKAQNCDFTAFEDVEHEMHNDRSQDEVYAMMVEFMIERTV